MFFYLSKLLMFLLNPIIWIFLILILLLLKKVSLKKGVFIIFLALYIPGNGYVIQKLYSYQEPVPKILDHKAHFDVGVVLGGFAGFSSDSKGINFNKGADRLIFAVSLYHQKKIKKILISGGSGLVNFDKISESVIAKNFILNLGVKENDILIEDKSRNTHENAFYSAKLIKAKKIKTSLLITSAFHMKRAEGCFKKEGVENIVTFPVDYHNDDPPQFKFSYYIIPETENITQFNNLIHEWLGILVYKIKGYI